MILQNLALTTEALGLGGFPNFARHENSWFEALGFKMARMPASHYLGAPKLLTTIAGWLHRDPCVAFPVGLEYEGKMLLKPYCPPHYATMEAAVRAFVETKFGLAGTYRGRAEESGWRNAKNQSAEIPGPGSAAVDAVISYCDYVYRRYGRFPSYTAPFRTVIGFQVCRVDTDFYDKFYQAEALSDTVREASLRVRAKS